MRSADLPRIIKRQKPPKPSHRCSAHRAWVRRHHCSVPKCGGHPIECAHVRLGGAGGIGLKPADRWCLSLCVKHHAEQHRLGERRFAAKYDLDLAELAKWFALRSPYRERLAEHESNAEPAVDEDLDDERHSARLSVLERGEMT